MVGRTTKAVVVGAGISGLACALRLRGFGIASLVLEAGDRPGGTINTIRRDGFLFEAGPQCPRFPAALWNLVRRLNLQSEFVRGDAKLKRYILRGGHLHPAPLSPLGLLLTHLVGARSKVRVLTEPFRSSCPPLAEETLAEFVQRKFGQEILDNLVDPFVATVFQGDPYKMGMQSALPALVGWERKSGSVVRGAIRARRSNRDKRAGFDPLATPVSHGDTRGLNVTKALPTLGSFRSGMGRLPERLAEELSGYIQYKSAIESVVPMREEALPEGRWQVFLSDGRCITTEHLILATPADVSAKLLASAIPRLSDRLRAIEYAPVCVTSFVYARSTVANPLNGFGFMVPRGLGMRTTCTFWNSSLFPERAPKGKVLVTSFCSCGSGAGDEESFGGER
ncbi:MAG: protoporphyrinogen oxidase, partial [Candidatus Sulfotelmatobacter sp.]